MSGEPSTDASADFMRVAAVRTLGDPLLTPGEARMLLALRSREGRPSDTRDLHRLIPPKAHGERQGATIFRVWASRIRSKTYGSAVRSAQGVGYWLDPAMIRSIDAVTQ